MNIKLTLSALVIAAAALAYPDHASAQGANEERTAFQACMSENNIARPQRPADGERRERPSEEQMAARKAEMDKVRACMVAKGFTMPEHGPGGPGGRGGRRGPPPGMNDGERGPKPPTGAFGDEGEEEIPSTSTGV